MIQPRFDWQRTPRSRRREVAKWTAILLAFAAVFAVGVALGEALHDNPSPNGTVTFVRTLNPTAP